MVTLQFLKKILRTMAIIVVAIGTSSPVTTSAATVRADVVSDIQVHIDTPTLTSCISKPTISGTATGIKKLKVTVYKEDTTRSVFTKSTVGVSREEWRVKVSKKLSDGNYTVVVEGVKVKGVKNILATETLVVNTKGDIVVSSQSVLSVSSIPLLSGGNARAGTTVPISYLQVNNTGKESISLKGFWIAQNGSAQTESVIGLSAIDDQSLLRGSVGGNEGSVLFKKGQAFVPADAVLAPGEMRLFTIKAQITGNLNAHLGKQLMLDIISVESNSKSAGSFPIRGTTWNLVR